MHAANSFSFVSNFILPYCIEALNSKTGFVFGSVAFLGILFIYFCIPECKGKTLEQVDRMFQEGVPLRKFGAYQVGPWYVPEGKAGVEFVEIEKCQNVTG